MLARLYQLFKVHVALAQNQVHFVVLQVTDRGDTVAQDVARGDDTEQTIATWVRHFLENGHFSQKAPRSLRITVDMLVALTGVLSLRRQVKDLHDLAIRALA